MPHCYNFDWSTKPWTFSKDNSAIPAFAKHVYPDLRWRHTGWVVCVECSLWMLMHSVIILLWWRWSQPITLRSWCTIEVHRWWKKWSQHFSRSNCYSSGPLMISRSRLLWTSWPWTNWCWNKQFWDKNPSVLLLSLMAQNEVRTGTPLKLKMYHVIKGEKKSSCPHMKIFAAYSNIRRSCIVCRISCLSTTTCKQDNYVNGMVLSPVEQEESIPFIKIVL